MTVPGGGVSDERDPDPGTVLSRRDVLAIEIAEKTLTAEEKARDTHFVDLIIRCGGREAVMKQLQRHTRGTIGCSFERCYDGWPCAPVRRAWKAYRQLQPDPR